MGHVKLAQRIRMGKKTPSTPCCIANPEKCSPKKHTLFPRCSCGWMLYLPFIIKAEGRCQQKTTTKYQEAIVAYQPRPPQQVWAKGLKNQRVDEYPDRGKPIFCCRSSKHLGHKKESRLD